MTHFFSVGERALLRVFGKTERDVLVRYGKSLVAKAKGKARKGKINALKRQRAQSGRI